MDWKACIKENLLCPRRHVSCGALTVYTNLIVNEFRKFDALPVPLVWRNDITADDVLYDNAASWHHSCQYEVCQSKSGQDKGKKGKTKY